MQSCQVLQSCGFHSAIERARHCAILTARSPWAITRDMSEFFAMGGYAAYVWPAYGATALILGGLGYAVWRRGQILKKRLAEQEAQKKE